MIVALLSTFLSFASPAFAGTVDLNTATAEELDALPGIGPKTAEAILAYRKEHGRFGSVDELDSVAGIGEATMAKLRPLVSVGAPGAAAAVPAEPATPPAKGRKAGKEAAEPATPATPAASAKGRDAAAATVSPAAPAASGSGCPVNINTADTAWLMDLPGVGESKAAAIVASRQAAGPFASCADLDGRVKGFGAASVAKLSDCCVVK